MRNLHLTFDWYYRNMQVGFCLKMVLKSSDLRNFAVKTSFYGPIWKQADFVLEKKEFHLSELIQKNQFAMTDPVFIVLLRSCNSLCPGKWINVNFCKNQLRASLIDFLSSSPSLSTNTFLNGILIKLLLPWNIHLKCIIKNTSKVL